MAILTICTTIHGQLLLDSDLMIKEFDLDEQNLLPEKEIIYMRQKRDDDTDVGSGSFDFTPISHPKQNSSSLLNATRAINLDSITLVVNTNQDSKFQSTFIIVTSSIGGVIAIGLVIGLILLAYYVKKRSPINPSRAIPSAPLQPSHGAILAYDKNETNGNRGRRINVTNTTMTQIDI